MSRTPVVVIAVIGMSCAAPVDVEYVFEMPSTVRGWVKVDFGISGCAPMAVVEKQRTVTIPSPGETCTSTPLESKPSSHDFVAIAPDGTRKRIVGQPELMVWGMDFGHRETTTPTSMVFFIGTKAEFEHAPHHPFGEL